MEMSRAERRRLEKAYKNIDRNKEDAYAWGVEMANKIESELRIKYQEKFQKELAKSIDYFIVAIMYALHFSEKTRFGQKRIDEFIDDITATVDMFTRGEYSPEDYVRELEKDKIYFRTKEKE